MNDIDMHPDYKMLYNEACDLFRKTNFFSCGTFDETFFTMRVFETAKLIIGAIKEPVHEQTILTAALLHDIGKSAIDESKTFGSEGGPTTSAQKKEFRSHARKSVPLARSILQKQGHSKVFIEDVCYLIKHHDQRGDKMDARSLELSILQDADLVADCGIVDIMRNFSYAGRFKRGLIPSIEFAMNRTDRVDKDGNLNLEVSRRMAKKRMDAYWELVKLLEQELHSELL